MGVVRQTGGDQTQDETNDANCGDDQIVHLEEVGENWHHCPNTNRLADLRHREVDRPPVVKLCGGSNNMQIMSENCPNF